MELNNEQLAILRLIRSDNIGPKTFFEFVNHYGSAEKACVELEMNPPKLRGSILSLANEKMIKSEIKATNKLGGKFLFYCDSNYPTPLKSIADTPPVLTVVGNSNVLNSRQLAIVGNRNASASSMRFTEDLAMQLIEENITITSGMARGIDTAAHRGALRAGGTTIAVLAGGIDHIYPPENEGLYKNIIASGGAVISEMPLGMAPTSRHFPRRNRIVSGLSLGVLVIEASVRSGSLITAKCALEQGREVFAMPGSPMDPRAKGPNYLLRQGATLVEDLTDIMENLPNTTQEQVTADDLFGSTPTIQIPSSITMPDVTPPSSTSKTPIDIIKSLLSTTPIPADELIQMSGLNGAEVLIAITELDIEGKITRCHGGIALK